MHEGTSARAAQLLKEMGYEKVYALKGGWREWKKAGYPTEPKQSAESQAGEPTVRFFSRQ